MRKKMMVSVYVCACVRVCFNEKITSQPILALFQYHIYYDNIYKSFEAE